MENNVIDLPKSRAEVQDERPFPFVAIPIHDFCPAHFLQSMVGLASGWQKEWPVQAPILFSMAGDALVTRSRNHLTSQFLQSPATDLVFIDCDIVFTPEQLMHLCTHDQDIVCGIYMKKNHGQSYPVLNGNYEPCQVDRHTGLLDIRYGGTGFMRIRRRVFERMIEAYPEIAYAPDHAPDSTDYDFWSVGVFDYQSDQRRYLLASQGRNLPEPEKNQRPRYLSEDWYFCQRALDLGFKVYADATLVLGHVGECTYPTPEQQVKLQQDGRALEAGTLSSDTVVYRVEEAVRE